MPIIRTALVGVWAASAALLGTSLYWRQGTPKTVWDVEFEAWSPPAGVTRDDCHEFFVAWAEGKPIPAGWARDEGLGSVRARVTGLVHFPSGKHQVVITAVDDTSDMKSAEVLINGVSQGTLDRGNGAILDYSGQAILTTSILVRDTGTLVVRLEWTGDAGHVSAHEATVHF